MLVLGIESSCDDTGAAVVTADGRVLGEALASQANILVIVKSSNVALITNMLLTGDGRILIEALALQVRAKNNSDDGLHIIIGYG